MPAESVAGRWQLARTDHETGEVIDTRDPGERDAAVAGWLHGSGITPLDDAQPAEGLLLEIAASGDFTETKTGQPRTWWYDEDGIELIDDAAPFDGRIVPRGGALYLRPGLPAEAMAVRLKRDERYAGLALRIDDGDTLVADRIEPMNGRLVRTVSVVTDEAYPSRVTLLYDRVMP